MDDFAKVMMATPTFSLFSKDSQPEASLLDGRRALLAFARGKARGTTTLGESGKGSAKDFRSQKGLIWSSGLRVTVKLRVKHSKILRQHQVSPKFRHVSQGMNESKPLTHVFLFLFLFLKGSVSLSWIWHNMVLTWPKGLQGFILEVWLHPGEELV